MLMQRAAELGHRLEVPGVGAYLRWRPGAGAEVWVQADRDGSLIGLNPHFVGDGRLRFGALELRPGEPGTLDGSLHGWVDPPADDPHQGLYPLLVDLPDAHLAQLHLVLPSIVTLQLAAFAHELACYQDEAAYYAAHEQGRRFAAESFFPTGPFVRPGEVERAEAVFTGRVLGAEMRINPATGVAFHVLLVRTLGGVVLDVVADPIVVTGEPVVGGVVLCLAWLSGRVIGTGP
jgi:hypothetical protein